MDSSDKPFPNQWPCGVSNMAALCSAEAPPCGVSSLSMRRGVHASDGDAPRARWSSCCGGRVLAVQDVLLQPRHVSGEMPGGLGGVGGRVPAAAGKVPVEVGWGAVRCPLESFPTWRSESNLCIKSTHGPLWLFCTISFMVTLCSQPPPALIRTLQTIRLVFNGLEESQGLCKV